MTDTIAMTPENLRVQATADKTQFMASHELIGRKNSHLIGQKVRDVPRILVEKDEPSAAPEPETAPAPVPVPALPPTLDFQSGWIAFDGGVPVGGWGNVRLHDNGNFEYIGHFHVSGAPSYNANLVWVIVDSQGTAITFAKKVHLAGTFESGSRDGDWNDAGNNPLIAQHWAALHAGWHARWNAGVNWDLSGTVDQALDALKVAGTVVATVAAIV
jgi:hypothetical protein